MLLLFPSQSTLYTMNRQDTVMAMLPFRLAVTLGMCGVLMLCGGPGAAWRKDEMNAGLGAKRCGCSHQPRQPQTRRVAVTCYPTQRALAAAWHGASLLHSSRPFSTRLPVPRTASELRTTQRSIHFHIGRTKGIAHIILEPRHARPFTIHLSSNERIPSLPVGATVFRESKKV